MKLLGHEVYDQSEHFWYELNLMKEGQYGFIFNTEKGIMDDLVKIICHNIKENFSNEGMYWYFGKELESILLMVRYKDGKFIIQVNLSDFDFALNIDQVISWKEDLEKALNNIEI